mgnify:CR=1 FL=1
MKDNYVPAEKLVATAVQCRSAKEVAEKLGMTVANASARMHALRKMGVKIPKLPWSKNRSAPRLDVDRLNEIAAAAAKQKRIGFVPEVAAPVVTFTSGM